MGMFSGVEKAKASVGGNYLRPGSYIVRINRVKKIENRKGVDFIAVEMTTLKSWGEQENRHSVGEDTTYLYKENDSFLGNWKAFVMGVTGCEESEVTEQESESITSDKQPFSGLVVPLSGVTVTKKDGNPFTKAQWGLMIPQEEWSSVLSEEALAILK